MTTAWPKSAVELSAPHCLSDFGACASCGQPAHTTSHDSAVHTTTGLYRCSGWPGGTAELDTTARDGDRDNEIAEAEEKAAQNAAEEERGNVGYDLGRKLQDLERRYLGDDDVPGQATIKAVLDAMHDWLVDL